MYFINTAHPKNTVLSNLLKFIMTITKFITKSVIGKKSDHKLKWFIYIPFF